MPHGVGIVSDIGRGLAIGVARAVQLSYRVRFVDLDGLPQDNTMGTLNTRSLTDVRRRARESVAPLRRDKFTTENRPNNKQKMYRQFSKPPEQLPSESLREYPRATSVEGDDRRYRGLEVPMGDSLFAEYDSLDIKNAKYRLVASSDYLYTPRFDLSSDPM